MKKEKVFMEKDGHYNVLVYKPGQHRLAFKELARWASDDSRDFTWFDAARMSCIVRAKARRDFYDPEYLG